MSIWENINSALILLADIDRNELSILKEGIYKLGMNLNQCDIVLVSTESHGEKDGMRFSKMDLNLFGKIKTDEFKRIKEKQHDFVLIIGDIDPVGLKLLKKKKFNTSVTINNNLEFGDIKLQSEKNQPLDLINFAKNTLTRIQ